MGKNIFFILSFVLFINSCKNKENEINQDITKDKSIPETSSLSEQQKIIHQDTLLKNINFKATLKLVKKIENTKKEYKDWMSNRARTLDSIFLLNNRKFAIKTTSYRYKNELIFYLHTLKHINDTVSIKPYLQNAIGKTTRGYTQNRILIFAMLNDKEANFIDIPEKLNPLALREELIDTLFKKIDSDIILCNRTKKCVYKDLRKNTQQTKPSYILKRTTNKK